MIKENSVDFLLESIKTEQFAIIEENHSLKKKISLNTELEYKINTDERRLGVFLSFSFVQAKKTFIKIQTSFHFIISEESWKSFIHDKKIKVAKEFASHLIAIGISSSRGILHAKTEGTEFNKYFLPLLYVDKLVTNDIVFSLEK